MKRVSMLGRWIATTFFCLSAIALIWQGAFFSTTNAIAAPTNNSLVAADLGDRVREKTSEDAGRAKNFIQDTKEKVERTANKNADRVDLATDDNNGFFARRARKDAARIEKRAEEDAARTAKAVDKTKNAVKRAVDN